MKEQALNWYANGGESSTAQNEAKEHAGGGRWPVWASEANIKGGTWSPGFLISEPQPKVGERERAVVIPCETAVGRQRHLEDCPQACHCGSRWAASAVLTKDLKSKEKEPAQTNKQRT